MTEPRGIGDYNKSPNTPFIRVPEEQEQGEAEKVPEEIMAKNFLNLTTGITLPSQEGKQTLKMINPNKSTPGHIIIKLLKNQDKEKCLKN